MKKSSVKSTPAKTPTKSTTTKTPPKKQAATKGTKTTDTTTTKKEATVPTPVTEEPKVEVKEPEKLKEEPIRIKITEIAEFVKDEDKTTRNKPKWPLIIDEQEVAARFLQYQNINLIQGFRPENMEPESLRKALLGAIRFGKPLAFDMMDVDLYEVLKTRFDDVIKGMPLFDMILDKSILKEENYSKLIKESDGDQYELNMFSDYYIDEFIFIVVTSKPNQNSEFTNKMFQVIIEKK